jgi:hypothetical protein
MCSYANDHFLIAICDDHRQFVAMQYCELVAMLAIDKQDMYYVVATIQQCNNHKMNVHMTA